MTNSTKDNTRVSEGIVLAALSAYTYLLAYIYELGYCSHFDLPAELIAPNLSTLLLVAAVVAGTLLPAFNYLGFTIPLFKAARDPTRRAYRDIYAYSAVISSMGIMLAAIYGLSIRGIAIYVGVSIVILLLLFLPAILSNRHLPLKERLEKHADIQDEDPFQLVDVFAVWLGRGQVFAVLLAITLLGLTYMIGNAEAGRQIRFLVLKSEPTTVIIRNYGDLMIATTFDKEKKEVSGEIRLMWLSEKKDIVLLNEPIGPLKIKPQMRQRPPLAEDS